MCTYADGTPGGHGEAGGMQTLRAIEDEVAGATLAANLGTRRQEAMVAVTRVQDYHVSPSLPLGNLPAANAHFWRTLHTAFPRVAAALSTEPNQAAGFLLPYPFHAAPATAYGAVVTAMTAAPRPGSNPLVLPVSGVAFQLNAGQLDKGLAIDLLVSPTALTGPSSVAALPPHQVSVTRVLVSMRERAYTQFKPDQRSHLASASMLFTAIRALEGKTVEDVARWVNTGLRRVNGKPPNNGALATDWATLRTQVLQLTDDARNRASTRPAHEWSDLMSSIMRGYLMVNQASSVTTNPPPVEELDRSGPHGEGAALARLSTLDAQVAATVALTPAQRVDALSSAVAHFDSKAARTKVIRALMYEQGPNDPAAATTAFNGHLDASTPIDPVVLDLKRSISEWVRFTQTAYPHLFPSRLDAKKLRKALNAKLHEQLTPMEMLLVRLPAPRAAKVKAGHDTDSNDKKKLKT
jgi:hypothetical protein